MTVALGMWLAAAAGGITGIFDRRMRPEPQSGSMVLYAIGGAVIGALCYGAFLVAGLVVGVLTFSTTPEPWPALICVIIGCALLLAFRGIHSAIASRFGMPERRGARPRSFDDLIEARPRGGSPTMWLGGVGIALLPLIYGVSCIVTQRGELGTIIWPSAVEGGAAIALGVGWIGVGLFFHFHFFFGLHATLHSHSRRGKSIALVTACTGLMVAGAWSIFAQLP